LDIAAPISSLDRAKPLFEAFPLDNWIGSRRAYIEAGGTPTKMRILLTTLSLLGLSISLASAADAMAGQAAYGKACKTCHGADGAANPAIAKMMNVEIRDLKSPEIQGLSDADFKQIITAGKGKMRPVTSVSGADLDNVIAYVHSLKK
jgi:mono/diheme cytochrome c family protein